MCLATLEDRRIAMSLSQDEALNNSSKRKAHLSQETTGGCHWSMSVHTGEAASSLCPLLPLLASLGYNRCLLLRWGGFLLHVHIPTRDSKKSYSCYANLPQYAYCSFLSAGGIPSSCPMAWRKLDLGERVGRCFNGIRQFHVPRPPEQGGKKPVAQ